MEIRTYKFTPCPNCKKEVSADAPLLPNHEAAEIRIPTGAVILLPERIKEIRKIKELGTQSTLSLEGYYCNIDCLISFISKNLIDGSNSLTDWLKHNEHEK